MAKSVPDAVMDVLLDEIATSNRMDVTSDTNTPSDLTNSLANVTMASGDFTKSQGDAGAGSRKLAIAAKSGVPVTANGTPHHVVLSVGGTTFKLITTCSGPDLTTGSNVDFPDWKYELGVPS